MEGYKIYLWWIYIKIDLASTWPGLTLKVKRLIADMLTPCRQRGLDSQRKVSGIHSVGLVNHIHPPTLKFTPKFKPGQSEVCQNDSNG